MKMSSLKSIYMEILLIETQTEITTFKTVMVTKKNARNTFLVQPILELWSFFVTD